MIFPFVTGSWYFCFQRPDYPRDCQEVNTYCFNDRGFSGPSRDTPDLPRSSGVYRIKPDGYPEPFEVYCNNSVDGGGWTVMSGGLYSRKQNMSTYSIAYTSPLPLMGLFCTENFINCSFLVLVLSFVTPTVAPYWGRCY